MDNATKAEVIGTMFGAYGQADDAKRVAIYVKLLSDIPAAVLGKACKKLMLESKFLPSIAEIVEASRSLLGTANDDKRIREWAEAWNEIELAMQRTPWGSYPVFSRPEIAQAVESFGWYNLQTCLAEKIDTVRAQMRRIYEDVCKRTKEQGHNEYVLGRSKTGLLEPSVRTRKDLELLRRGDIKLLPKEGEGLTRISSDSFTMPIHKSKGMTFAEWRKANCDTNG